MHLYHTEKVDTPEDFRSELSQFMLIIRTIISQYNYNMCGQLG